MFAASRHALFSSGAMHGLKIVLYVEDDEDDVFMMRRAWAMR